MSNWTDHDQRVGFAALQLRVKLCVSQAPSPVRGPGLPEGQPMPSTARSQIQLAQSLNGTRVGCYLFLMVSAAPL